MNIYDLIRKIRCQIEQEQFDERNKDAVDAEFIEIKFTRS